MNRKTCFFSGRVQGVGFRYTARNVAQQYDVRGYVKNLPDGRVELTMEGPEQEMEYLVEDLRDRMNGYIRHIDSNILPATGEFQQFQIKN